MRSRMLQFTGIVAIVFAAMLCPATAVLGADCNGWGGLDSDDIVYLITYFYSNGDPPPDMAACDCDGYPGVTIAEIPHITGVIFQGCSVYPPVGTDMLVPSDVRIWVIGQPDGVASFSARVFIRSPLEIEDMAIPFSYAAGPGQSELTCTNIDFTGSVANQAFALIRDDQKLFVILDADPDDTAVFADSEGLLCTVHFGLAGPEGDPITLAPTFTDRFSPILVTKGCYDGVGGDRIFYPAFMPPPIGDCNCDDAIDIDDAVWLITYIFSNGPEPYDCY